MIDYDAIIKDDELFYIFDCLVNDEGFTTTRAMEYINNTYEYQTIIAKRIN